MTYKLETSNDIPWTPTFTGLGTVTDINFTYRKIARNLIFVVGWGKTGTVTSNPMSFTLPTGMVVASSLADSKYNIVGWGHRDTSTTASVGVLARDGDSTCSLSYVGTSNTNHLTPANGDAVFGNTESFSLFATIPINEV